MTPLELSYLKMFIAIAAFLFGIYKYFQTRQIKKLISNEAMELHNNIGLALGAIQNAKNAINNGTSPAISVGETEGYAQAILQESAKLFCNLRNTTIDDIDELINRNQLPAGYRNIYISYSQRQRGCIRKFFMRIGRWF
jgi:hypothetical protein